MTAPETPRRFRVTRDPEKRPLRTQIRAALHTRVNLTMIAAIALTLAFSAGVIAARLHAGIPL